MKRIIIIFSLVFSYIFASAQCTTSTGGQWPSTPVMVTNSGEPEVIAFENFPNAEYSIIQGLEPGKEYAINGVQLYMTVLSAVDSAVIVHGMNVTRFTAPAGVTGLIVYWHLDADCNTSMAFEAFTQITCTSCCSGSNTLEVTQMEIDNAVNGRVFKSDSILFSNAVVGASNIFTFRSSTVDLNTDFEVALGAELSVKTGPCTP